MSTHPKLLMMHLWHCLEIVTDLRLLLECDTLNVFAVPVPLLNGGLGMFSGSCVAQHGDVGSDIDYPIHFHKICFNFG